MKIVLHILLILLHVQTNVALAYAREWNQNLNDAITDPSVMTGAGLETIRDGLQASLDAGCTPPRPCANPQDIQASIASLNNLIAGRANMADYDRVAEIVGIGAGAALAILPAYGLIRGAAEGAGSLLSQVFRNEAATASSAQNIAHVRNLVSQLRLESASSPFTVEGALTRDAINGSYEIVEAANIGNMSIPSGFGKYTTRTFQSPAGDFRIHFYKNPTTGEIFYGQDYKIVFNKPGVKP